MRRKLLIIGFLLTCNAAIFAQRAPGQKPNIVFILADDLGYGDVGVYGQQKILTPNIDKLAKEGTQFTDFYAGAPVCSPSRGSILTGLHTGHATIRGNATEQGGIAGKKGKNVVYRANLTKDDYTIGNLLQDAGYNTSLVGKWHVDGYDSLATPLQRGFDKFSGWLINIPSTYTSIYWPDHRYINGKLVTVVPNTNEKRGYYETNMCTDEALAYLKTQKDGKKPFFLMLNFNNPHSPLDVPDQAIYKHMNWPEDMKTYAAMVYYMDQAVGKVKDYLIKSGLSENTIVFFASDNGPRSEPTSQLKAVSEFFDSNGKLKGYKRDMYEGGIRIPFIAWAPFLKNVPKISNVPGYFADIMPTFAEIAGKTSGFKTDGLSIYPAIKGEKPKKDRFLYWEFFELGFEQGIRYGRWKGVKRHHKLELYDLKTDIGETNDVAASHPDIVKQIEDYLLTARTDSPYWTVK
ncbi:arylsulfatase A-like enzyme [Pedobacter sp. AK013]|uniref:arylsulfatase n=1 Tax=Pedobacter sp. AK013 TaxID=2723071 RepID=UPI0016183179|nr:arylsulfatase [Pedobacter sp. AK013]MBB6235564.1 arylsulfatase A-like enzyme [Pedobacter sp. AK013]